MVWEVTFDDSRVRRDLAEHVISYREDACIQLEGNLWDTINTELNCDDQDPDNCKMLTEHYSQDKTAGGNGQLMGVCPTSGHSWTLQICIRDGGGLYTRLYCPT